jgi:hypothetical protein
MRKPKVVCVTGSALLAVLTFLVVPVAIELMLAYWHLLPPIPRWVQYSCALVSVIGVPWVSAPFYYWYFWRCYRPPFIPRGVSRHG